MPLQIVVSDEVAAELGDDQTALVRAGRAAPAGYECLICRTSGDATAEPAAAVLFLDRVAGAMLLAWVHHRCGPSTVHPIADLERLYGRPDDKPAPAAGAPREAGPLDVTWATLARLPDGIHPALTIMPGISTRIVAPAGPGDHLVLEAVLEDLRAAGFAAVDLDGARPPVELPRWAVRTNAGRLAAITRPGGTWWTSNDPALLPADWRQAARRTRDVLLMVVAPGALPDVEHLDTGAHQDAMAAAARAGQVVGAVLPLRGTLS